MVQLIDTVFVAAVVGASILAFIRYLVGLGKTEEAASTSCTGCSSCSDSATIDLKR